MQKIARILGFTSKSGVSDRTHTEFTVNEVHVKWEEVPPGAQPYDCEMIMTVMGKMDEEAVKASIATKSTVPITFYVSVREWKERKFTDIHGYLPKSLMAEKK